MPYFGNAHILEPDGNSLSVKHQRIAEIINDLDDSLRLAWIPPAQRSSFDKHPFAICHFPDDGREPYVVMTMSEDEVDERLIAKIISRDTHQGMSIDNLDAEYRAHLLMEAKNRMEEMEERTEFAKAAYTSRKSVFKHNGVEYR
jgi:hypothetical protein